MAVISDRHGSVGVEDDGDFVASSCHGFVDGVIDNFVDEVVQASLRCRSDIHTGTFTDCFQSFENLYLALVVDLLLGIVINLCSLFESNYMILLYLLYFFRIAYRGGVLTKPLVGGSCAEGAQEVEAATSCESPGFGWLGFMLQLD